MPYDTEEDRMKGLSMLPQGFQGFGQEDSVIGQQNEFNLPPGLLGRVGLGTDGSRMGPNYFGQNQGRRSGDSGDIGWNTGTLGGIGDIMSGVGNLGQAWAAIKNVGLAKKGLEQKRQGWNANYAAQAVTTNNPILAQQGMLRSAFYNDPERAKQLKLVQPATLSG
tara:strand:- start:130 stop:624 length:495 start_codon:yes stop_codon:yes gene_type:complete